MKVKLVSDGCYSFGKKFIGSVLEAERVGTAYLVIFPYFVEGRYDWVYLEDEVEVIDEGSD